MLRRVAFADDDAPFAPADLDDRALADPVIGRRHRRDAAAVIPLALGEDRRVFVVEPGAVGEIVPQPGRILVAVARHHAGVQPFLLGDP